MDYLREYRRLDPLSDSVFSCVFADDSTRVSMLEIINAVLVDAGDEPIAEILTMNSQYGVIPENIGRKSGRLDVRAVSDDGTLFDIEVQLRFLNTMNERPWFYGSRLMSDSLKEGESYLDTPKVRVINLLDFSLRTTNDDFLQPIGMMYKKPPTEIASDSFRLYNIELPKFRSEYKTLESVKDNPLLRWLYMFENAYKDESEMEALTSMSEGLMAFAKKYNRSIFDPKLRQMYEYDMSARMDEKTRIAEAINQGLAEGHREALMGVIMKMYNDNMPMELIYKYSNAPREEVDEIVKLINSK